MSHSSVRSSGDTSPATPATSSPAAASEPGDRAELGPAANAELGPELGFDQVLDRLRQVVLRLEQGSLSLEQALLAFEDGVKLSRRGSSILDAAEQRVELLIQQDDGSERRQPFPAKNPPGSSPNNAP